MTSFSLYHEIRSQYKRNYDGALLEEVQLHNTPSIYQVLCSRHGTPVMEICIDRHRFRSECYNFGRDLSIHRFELFYRTHVSGLIFLTTGGLPKPRYFDLRTYFAITLLVQPNAQTVPIPAMSGSGIFSMKLAAAVSTSQASVEKICGVFEEHLLFQAPENDQWHLGQHLFREKVSFYVDQRSKIRFCLPAFPCKSSNPDKVASQWPDGAEYEALTNLYSFCRAITAFYPPGAVLEIISDGHVFSDCVGVDDETVSEYIRRLRTMATSIQDQIATTGGRRCSELITFQGLTEILYPNHWIRKLMKREFANLDKMFHPVATRRTS